jgi:hypothetical protein
VRLLHGGKHCMRFKGSAYMYDSLAVVVLPVPLKV